MSYDSRITSEVYQYQPADEITTTYATICQGQNEAFAEGLLTAANWMNDNGLTCEASSMLLALVSVKPYGVPNA